MPTSEASAGTGGARPGAWRRGVERVTRRRVLYHVLLVMTSLVFAIPLVWLLSTSLQTNTQIALADSLPDFFIPEPVAWENYELATSRIPFWRYVLNTVLVTTLSIVGVTLASAAVAYGFARYHWPGRDVVFVILISTMMLPPQVTMVPTYLVFAELGWVNTLYPLWVPHLFGTAFFIFLLRQFFRNLPAEVFEAAELDGAGPVRTFFQIALPLVRPALIAVVIFQFLASWNDFLTPLIYLQDPDLYTLSLGLEAFKSRFGGVDWGPLMAASVLMVSPVFILFFVAQKQFVEGIVLGGVKG